MATECMGAYYTLFPEQCHRGPTRDSTLEELVTQHQ